MYYVKGNSSIQLNDTAFIKNIIKRVFLNIRLNSNAIIQNNTLTENKVSFPVYYVAVRSTIKLYNVALFRNRLMQNLLYMILYSHAKLINNTVTGNDMLVTMLFALSSSLEMDRVLINSNTFNQLIWLVRCNTSLDSMKIAENIVRKDIIYIENTAGMRNNTYIENFDQLMTSGVIGTCTYRHCIDSLFEIASIELVWKYELLLSARPIIQLRGKVIFSNARLLVDSISEIEVLHYATDGMIMIHRTGPKMFYHTCNISSLFIGCTKASAKHIMKLGSFRCIPCTRGTYTFKNGSLKTLTHFQSKKITTHENTSFTCLDCPVGGNCTASIKSKSNFYGFQTNEQKIKFLPCPKGFCCTGSQCNTIKSCNKNRVGILCGRCTESYTESFLRTNCISINSCQNIAKFWVVYCIYALTLATFLYYMRDVINLVKTMGRSVSKCFQPCQEKKDFEVEIDMAIDLVGGEEQSEKISHFTVSGIFTLIVSFYQIKQLISVDIHYTYLNDFSFVTFLSDCLNLELVIITSSSYCPMVNLDEVSKTFIKTHLLIAALLIASLINYFMSRICNSFCPNPRRRSRLTPSERLGVCFIRIVMFSYKSMASASLILLNCVRVADVHVLFIKGDMECFQWWQLLTAVFFSTWVLFFPFSLKISFNMFMKDKISFATFIWHLTVPFIVVGNYILRGNDVSVDLVNPRNVSKVKKILSEIFEESYRLKTNDLTQETVFYETCQLYQRVLLAIVATFCINPIVRITLMTPTVILIAISYFLSKPYKPEMYILHWMEVFSILGIFVCLIYNMFRGFLYVYDINDKDPVTFVWQVFAVLDLLFSPTCVLVYFFILKPIYNKAKCKINFFYLTLRRGCRRSVS